MAFNVVYRLREPGVFGLVWALVVVSLVLAADVRAQQRFVDPLFSDIEVRSGIQFGVGVRAEAADQPLLLDVYAPRNDVVEDRPVIILAFPGGFVDGARDDPEMVSLATRFAQRGYVAASIDYRLIEERPRNNSELEISIVQAVHDLRAAVRFFREDAANGNEFGTDGETIFVGGVSAGAVMAAVAGVLDEGDELRESVADFLAENGGMAGNSSTNTEFSSDVSGVLQISGAIRSLSWIEPGEPPIYAAHEEFDPVVPCDTLPGIAFVEFGLALTSSGACDIIPAARAVGVPTEFFFLENEFAHIGYSAAEITEIINGSAAFFFREVLSPRAIASALLPGSRSIRTGVRASVFSSVVNASQEPLDNCRIDPLTPVDADFEYQLADLSNAPVGEPNSSFSLAPGEPQGLVLSFTATEAFEPTEVFFQYSCDGIAGASQLPGVNTLLLSAADEQIADVIGLTTVVDLVGSVNSTALFAVGSANVGVGADVTVSVDDGGAGLPIELRLCETNSSTGACESVVAQEVTLTYDASSTRSFAIFANILGPIENQPGANRIFVRFRDSQGVVRGSTSTSVRTQ